MARALIAMLNVTSNLSRTEAIRNPCYTYYGTEERPCCEAICKAFCELPYGVVIGL